MADPTPPGRTNGPPPTRQDPAVVETYHGVEVPDPYRWLEQDVRESDEVAGWVQDQNEATHRVLASIEVRDTIREKLRQRWNYERSSPLFKGGGRYFFFHNTGLKDQNVLHWTESLSEEPRVLIDPNGWSEDGTICLASTSVSSDGERVACLIQESGSDWMTCRVFDVDGGRFLPDELRWIKHSAVSWTRDCRGFFYSRFEAPRPGHEFQDLNENHKVYYHRLGTEQSHDVMVYARPDHPDWGFNAEVTNDGHYLVITIWKGTDAKYRVAVRDLLEPYSSAVDLICDFEHEYTFVGHEGRWLFFVTDEAATRRRLIAIDVSDPTHRREIIPQIEDSLQQVRFLGNLFVAVYLRNAHSLVRVHSITGEHVRDVELPGIGTVDGFFGRRTDTETFYSFSSFVHPPAIYRYDLVTGESRLYRRSDVGVDPDDFEVRQVFCRSRDGTQVPMFLAHRRGIELDGSHRTLLYGYGGFNVPLTPSFAVSRLVWLELGGVFAMANLRGGGEFGEDWHQAGTRLQKQNVFDDFVAAAEWLIASGYTRPRSLAIQGGSNGGLLVGAVMTQRPELFGACLPAVGVMDMLRFHLFTAGRYWVDDYGCSSDPEEFKALLAYSPYHNLRPGTCYPATLVTTADTDDRVVPGHSFKFAAALQAAHAGNRPVLIRVDVRSGHGAGLPTSKAIELVADQWAFLTEYLEGARSESAPESAPVPGQGSESGPAARLPS